MKDLLVSLVSVIIAIFLSWFGSGEEQLLFGFPVLFIIALSSFFIHWIIFIPSYLFKSEKFYDITGTIAYLFMFGCSAYISSLNSNSATLRTQLVLFLVILWSLRLGLFLLFRVFKAGEDRRFNNVKTSFSKFFMYFTISALWTFVTTANALIVILNNSQIGLDLYFALGISLWIIGFSLEVIADEQKRRFKKSNKTDQFIKSGLWSVSRHPNYFGEILLWFGIAFISFPVLGELQYLTLISPLFVIMLLTKVSGINQLEEYADEKWGHLEDYKDYKRKTSILIPFI